MKKPRIALWIVLGVLILAFFTAEIVGLSKYKKNRQEKGLLYYEDIVWVTVKAEYDEKFLNGEITLEDLNLENAKEIKYFSNEPSTMGDQYLLKISLKSSGYLRCCEAIIHCKQFEFVESGGFYYR